MRIGIVHYHLRPGGVTRIIEHAVAALRPRGARVAVISGEPPAKGREPAAPVCVEPALGYAGQGMSAPALAGRLEAAVRRVLGGTPDIWHVHNHALGKNVLVPQLVHEWSRRGTRLLLQIHDFAEDGRPGNYRLLRQHLGRAGEGAMGADLYPLSGTTHYAVLNGRDEMFLGRAGVPSSHLHALPNPVALSGVAEGGAGSGNGRTGYVYPTRAIRRKNIGEFLLWSVLCEEPARFGVTLAPQNPVERPRYEAWVELAGELDLPVDFETGQGRPFSRVLAEARALVTTSVAEGFGMAFLEPWLAGRPVVGRNLPEITKDFVAAGIDLSLLYERLEVPLSWLGQDRVRKRIERGLRDTWSAYDREVRPEDVARAWHAAVRDDRIDFGRLDEPLQQEVIRCAVSSSEARQTLRGVGQFAGLPDAAVTAHNRKRVMQRFDVEAYGVRLEQIYRTVAESPPGVPGRVDGDTLLGQFLAPDRFYLLRT